VLDSTRTSPVSKLRLNQLMSRSPDYRSDTEASSDEENDPFPALRAGRLKDRNYNESGSKQTNISDLADVLGKIQITGRTRRLSNGPSIDGVNKDSEFSPGSHEV
jgi:hypothetical protein